MAKIGGILVCLCVVSLSLAEDTYLTIKPAECSAMESKINISCATQPCTAELYPTLMCQVNPTFDLITKDLAEIDDEVCRMENVTSPTDPTKNKICEIEKNLNDTVTDLLECIKLLNEELTCMKDDLKNIDSYMQLLSNYETDVVKKDEELLKTTTSAPCLPMSTPDKCDRGGTFRPTKNCCVVQGFREEQYYESQAFCKQNGYEGVIVPDGSTAEELGAFIKTNCLVSESVSGIWTGIQIKDGKCFDVNAGKYVIITGVTGPLTEGYQVVMSLEPGKPPCFETSDTTVSTKYFTVCQFPPKTSI